MIRGQRGAGKSIGLRADMDALPILEANDLPYKSTVPESRQGLAEFTRCQTWIRIRSCALRI